VQWLTFIIPASWEAEIEDQDSRPAQAKVGMVVPR
jgi:hypothetical protein